MTEKEQRILRHVQVMSVLASCMEIEYMNDLVDMRWKDPNMNNHIRRIKESLEQIKKGLNFKYKIKDKELMTIDHPVQVHRLFNYFSTMDTTQLSELMDAYEEYDKINPSVLLED